MYSRPSAASVFDAFEVDVRALLAQFPSLPATVIAERVGWTGSPSWFRKRVAMFRPEFAPRDPADRLEHRPGEQGQSGAAPAAGTRCGWRPPPGRTWLTMERPDEGAGHHPESTPAPPLRQGLKALAVPPAAGRLPGYRPVVQVLGIGVPSDLLARWTGWLAPTAQPFLITDGTVAGGRQPDRPLCAEVRDTFQIYDIPDGSSCVWLTEPEFTQLPRSSRVELARARRAAEPLLVPSVRSWPALRDRTRDQVDVHRFLWWPSLLAGHEDRVLADYIEDGRRPSRHHDVENHTWQQAARVLPGARALAGTFPSGSGPNCFGAVLAAAGVTGAETVWMQREPFEMWLSQTTRVGGRDGDVGTVLV